MKIADNLDLNLDALRGQRTIFQGAPGSGKSSGCRLLLEACYGSFQNLILDVEDEFHTLRAEGRDYAIIGGQYGDIPLGPMDMVEDLALTLLRVGVSTVLQIGDLTLADKRLFVARFARGLMRAPVDLWHPVVLMLDESHLFVPEQAVEMSSEPIIHYATAGRKRGFGAIFATQRLSLFSKDVLGVCQNKFLGRVEQSADRRAAADQLGFTPKSDEATGMQAFTAGEFYCVGPALSPMPLRAHLYLPATSAPTPGSTVVPMATPAAIQRALAALAAAVPVPAVADGATPAPAPATATAVTKSALEAEYARGRSDAKVSAETAWDDGHAAGRKEGYADGSAAAREDAGRRLLQFVQEFVVENADAQPAAVPPAAHVSQRPASKPMPPRSTKAVPAERSTHAGSAPTSAGLTAPLQRCIDAIAWWAAVGFPEVRREMAAVIAGYSPKASTFGVYISELKEKDLVAVGKPGHILLTDGGKKLANAPAVKGRPDILRMAKDQVSNKEADVLDAVAAVHPDTIRRDDLADKLGLSRTASTLGVYLSALSKRGFVETAGKGEVRAASFLFARAKK